MLNTRQLERYAEVMLWALKTARKERFRKGDVVALRYHLPARPLAEVLFGRLMQMGLNPVPRSVETPKMERSFYTFGSPAQLAFIPPGEERLTERLNGSIFLYAPESIRHLSDVDPRKIASAAVARKPLRNLLNHREALGAFSWTHCLFPTAALSRAAGMSLNAYAEQVAAACFLETADPVSSWKTVHGQIRRIKKRLSRLPIDRLHVESANVDLVIHLGKDRKWLGLSGRNIPSFEVFVSPDWRGTKGVYFADQPSFRNGNIVGGVRLEFKNGRVASARARKGETFLKKQLEMDPGASRVGEFSLTDRRFSRIRTFMANTLYDENYGGQHGNCHVALGSAYADAYAGPAADLDDARREALGFNDSALHWDLVNTEKKRVTAHLTGGGRRTLYENGEFAL